jgi:hypothetical protein
MPKGNDAQTVKPSGDAVYARGKLKRLVFGALIANGAVGAGLLAVSAQAHGNASSHAAAQLDWTFDNFTLRRETLLNPSSPSTELLSTLDRERRENQNALGEINKSLNGASTLTLAQRTQLRTEAQRLSESSLKLRAESMKINDRLALTPLSRQVITLLQAGDAKAAASAIEASGNPETVLRNYSLVQLDLRNLGAVDGKDTPVFFSEVLAVTQAGVAYQEKAAPGDTASAAGLLHNLASAASPDRGVMTAEQTRIGREAAEKALQIRKSLGQAESIAIAEYMVGVYAFKAGDVAKAETMFTDSVTKLQPTSNKEALAWSTMYLGKTQERQSKATARQNLDRARTFFESVKNSTALDVLSQ